MDAFKSKDYFEIIGSRGEEEMEGAIVHPIPKWNDSELAGISWDRMEKMWRKNELQGVRKPQVLKDWIEEEDNGVGGVGWQAYAICSGIMGMALVLAVMVWCIYRIKYLNRTTGQN